MQKRRETEVAVAARSRRVVHNNRGTRTVGISSAHLSFLHFACSRIQRRINPAAQRSSCWPFRRKMDGESGPGSCEIERERHFAGKNGLLKKRGWGAGRLGDPFQTSAADERCEFLRIALKRGESTARRGTNNDFFCPPNSALHGQWETAHGDLTCGSICHQVPGLNPKALLSPPTAPPPDLLDRTLLPSALELVLSSKLAARPSQKNPVPHRV